MYLSPKIKKLVPFKNFKEKVNKEKSFKESVNSHARMYSKSTYKNNSLITTNIENNNNNEIK